MSQIAIWNLALGHLGDDATVSAPDELSRQAELCRQFWPTALGVALESHPWNFATRRAPLSPLTAVLNSGYSYAYAWPANAVAVWEVGDAEAVVVEHTDEARRIPFVGRLNTAPLHDFEVETLADGTRVILSNSPTAFAKFTKRVTDTTRFSAIFTDALSWLLASYLAGPILKGDEGRKLGQMMLQQFRYSVGQAAVSDSNQRRTLETVRENHRPDWMRAR